MYCFLLLKAYTTLLLVNYLETVTYPVVSCDYQMHSVPILYRMLLKCVRILQDLTSKDKT